ncbi:MAG: ATP-binding cassette domain-containing protein [Candidatus Babeliales bacterium]
MKLQNLTFTFTGQQKPFFNKLTITLQKGKLTALCGHNGAGKSTLLKLLAGQLIGEQLEGNFILNGVRYTTAHNRLPKELTKHIHLVHQDIDTMLATNMTAKENLQLAGMFAFPKLAPLPQINRAELTAQVSFDLDAPVHTLSGGQRQLLAIMMALQQKPSVLLLDEPTAALDTKNAHEVMQALTQLAHTSNTFVVMVCHNAELVGTYADERIELMR